MNSTAQIWTVSADMLALIITSIADEEKLCMSRSQIDHAAPRVMYRLFPHMVVEISAAIATGQSIQFRVRDI